METVIRGEPLIDQLEMLSSRSQRESHPNRAIVKRLKELEEGNRRLKQMYATTIAQVASTMVIGICSRCTHGTH